MTITAHLFVIPDKLNRLVVLNLEHCMNGTQMWAHIKHRHEELCNHHDINKNTEHTNSNNHSNVDSDNSHEHVQRILPQLPTRIASRPFGAYQYFYSLGDYNQLPPVGQIARLPNTTDEEQQQFDSFIIFQ